MRAALAPNLLGVRAGSSCTHASVEHEIELRRVAVAKAFGRAANALQGRTASVHFGFWMCARNAGRSAA
jgi:hypothetical protein